MAFEYEEVLGKEVAITEDGKSVLTFSYGKTELQPHFHPIYTPNGKITTDGFSDRNLQGLCFSFGTVKDRTNKELIIQFGIDTTSVQKPPVLIKNKVNARFIHETMWRYEGYSLSQQYIVTLYPLQNTTRVFDLTIISHQISGSLTFDDNVGLSFQAVEMEHRKVADSNNRIGELEVDGNESEWATLCGIADNTAVGVAMLSHPDNGKTCFKVEDAYNGYMLAQTPMFTLDTNATHTLKYRLVVYVGDLFTTNIADYYQEYITVENNNSLEAT